MAQRRAKTPDLAQRLHGDGQDALGVEYRFVILADGCALFDESIGQDEAAQPQLAGVQPTGVEKVLLHLAAEAADGPLLDGQQQRMMARELPDQLFVQRFGEPRVGHRRRQTASRQLVGCLRHSARRAPKLRIATREPSRTIRPLPIANGSARSGRSIPQPSPRG